MNQTVANAVQVLDVVNRQGITVRAVADANTLLVSPQEKVTVEIRELLLAVKPQLLRLLDGWGPEYHRAQKRYPGIPGVGLLPYVGTEVGTPRGRGILRQLIVGSRVAAVRLHGDTLPSKFDWREVRP